MVKAWYMPDEVVDQFAENHLDPPQSVSLDELENNTGVTCRKVLVDEARQQEILQQVPDIGRFTYHDVVEVSPEKMGSIYEEKLRIFFEEHLHTDDEVRFILAGAGFFDVRDRSDRWIRIAVEKGDFLTLPAGIYHRFTVDHNRYLKAMRLFIGEPVWTPYNRGMETDTMDARKRYREIISS